MRDLDVLPLRDGLEITEQFPHEEKPSLLKFIPPPLADLLKQELLDFDYCTLLAYPEDLEHRNRIIEAYL